MFDHTDMYSMGTSCGDAEREVKDLRGSDQELRQLIGALHGIERDLRAQLDRARTAVHRYFGHAGEVEACTAGICHAIVHPDALRPPAGLPGAVTCGPDEIREVPDGR